jgi:hypothetical protein
LTGFEPVFGDLGGKRPFVAAVARHLRSLRQDGVIGTLRALGPERA